MITYLLLPTFTTKAMDAANGFVAGERLDIRIAMLLDFGVMLRWNHRLDFFRLQQIIDFPLVVATIAIKVSIG